MQPTSRLITCTGDGGEATPCAPPNPINKAGVRQPLPKPKLVPASSHSVAAGGMCWSWGLQPIGAGDTLWKGFQCWGGLWGGFGCRSAAPEAPGCSCGQRRAGLFLGEEEVRSPALPTEHRVGAGGAGLLPAANPGRREGTAWGGRRDRGAGIWGSVSPRAGSALVVTQTQLSSAWGGGGRSWERRGGGGSWGWDSVVQEKCWEQRDRGRLSREVPCDFPWPQPCSPAALPWGQRG